MASIIPLNKSASAPEGVQNEEGEGLSRLLSLVEEDLTVVNRIIYERMESQVSLIPHLAAHLVSSGGKRLRPALVLACARLCGYRGERHRNLAAALEFIHTATLLHDDVVDSSGLRRGLPTANALFGNKASVLVGDYLYSRSFQVVVEDGSIDVLRIMSEASSLIAEGEVLQLTAQNDCATSEQAYLEIIQAKTAVLFAAACRIGAVVASASQAQEQALRTYGFNLGIAFQIIDDVLDYVGDQADLGKTIGNDFREGKVTLPVILAIQRGSEAERAFWKRTLTEQVQKEGDLGVALDMLRRHETLKDCIERARHYVAIARDALGLFPDGPLKDALLETASHMVVRQV